jgi:uncharacterized protein (TIGR00730 family)
MKSIAVFCGSSNGIDQNIIKKAYRLGTVLAKRDIKLVYGGSKIGLMGKLAEGCLDHNGEVLGVIPSFLKLKEIVHTGLTELIVTENMHDRKIKMYEQSDGFMIIPGGFGTMDEFFEITTWAQLGLHAKPIGILNLNGYYDPLIKQFQVMANHGFLKQDNLNAVLIDNTIDNLLIKMQAYQPRPVPKWLNKEGI